MPFLNVLTRALAFRSLHVVVPLYIRCERDSQHERSASSSRTPSQAKHGKLQNQAAKRTWRQVKVFQLGN